MKTLKRSLGLWLLMCLSAIGATPTVNVLVDLKDARLQSAPNYTNRTVWIQAMSIPNISSPSVVLGAPLVYVTDTNGQFWVSNLVQNLYQVSVKAPPRQELFKFLVLTNYPTEINAADNLVADSVSTFPAGSVAWAAAVTDQRYGGTVPRPWVDGWMLTLSNNTAVWTRNAGNLTNLNANGAFISSSSGTGTNTDIRWVLAAPSQWVRLHEADSHTVALEYQSGAIQTLMHTHDNFLHFDAAPTYDYATTQSIPYFDGTGKLVSLNMDDIGALTNDGNGNVGWYSGYVANVSPSITTPSFLDPITWINVAHSQTNKWTWDNPNTLWNFDGGLEVNGLFLPFTAPLNGALEVGGSFTVDGNGDIVAISHDALANPINFDGHNFWSTNFSSTVPLLGIQGGSSVPTVRVAVPFRALSITNDAATGKTVAYYDINKKLGSIANTSGALTNDGSGNVGWFIGFGANSIPNLNGTGTNTALLNPTLTNAVNYGNAFSSPGAGSQSERFGASSAAAGLQSTALGNQASAPNTASTAVGNQALANATGATAIGQAATASGLDSTAIGFFATTTTPHQIEMGTSSEYVDVPGALSSASITNRAGTASTVASYDVNKRMTSIANGTGWLHNNGSGTFVWSTPTIAGFDTITSGENIAAIMRVGTAANLYPTNGGNISANFATNVPITGVVGGLQLSGSGTHTKFTQSQGYPSLDFNSAFNSGIGTIVDTGDFSVTGNETNQAWTTYGVITNDTNGKKYSSPILPPPLMGTNVVLTAGSNILILPTYTGNVMTYNINGLAYDIRGLNNTFTGANLFSGASTFTAAVQISANLTVSGNATATGGLTNNSLTANTIIYPDTNKRLTSLANASGALTNNGSGVFGWYPSYATQQYVQDATNQLAIATTNRLLTLGTSLTNYILAVGQSCTNYANIMFSNAVIYTDSAINTATNPFDTIVDVNSKITGAATNRTYAKTTDTRLLINTNTSAGTTLYGFSLTAGITNSDPTGTFEVTNTAAANSFSLLSSSNVVIKGTLPNLALGTDTNALVSLNARDFMFQPQGTNALSITNSGNGIFIHGFAPLDLSFGNSYAGLVPSGNMTNASGFRVVYLDELRNLSASTNVSRSIGPVQSANYNALTTDEIILMNGNLTVTLPTAIGLQGHSYTIKTMTSGTNAILTSLAQTIDTSAKWTNVSQFKVTTLTSDGSNWQITGPNGQ